MKTLLKEAMEGGIGDHLDPDDVDADELAHGIEVELEHTNDRDEAEDVALDHLAEDPAYYTKLDEAGL